MARTVTDTEVEQHITTDADTPNLPSLVASVDQLATVDSMIIGSFDAIKALGRIEAVNFYMTVGDKLIAETALNIREAKSYKGLPYRDESGNIRHVIDFEEFCRVFLGKSYARTSELMRNYKQLGPELYEQAEKLGFRQRDYNALKALPEDDKKIIAQAIESEDLDKALDFMQQMATKHGREKELLLKSNQELSKGAASKDAVILKKDEKLNELDQQLESLRLDRPVGAHLDWPKSFKGYLDQLAITRKNLKHALGSLDVIRESAMAIEPESEAEEASLTRAREILAMELVGLHNECAEMVTALGMSFDRSLGAFSDARINLLQL